MYRSCWIIICVGPLLLWPNSLCVSATVVTSVNYIFEGFSPYATLRFFEFNDKGWNISENCIRDMYNFLEGLRRGSLWAVKLYDATAYYAGGALGGASSVRIQNPNICRSLLHQYKEQVQLASWSFLANETIVPFAVQIVMAHYLLEMIYDGGFKSEQIHQLICFPSSCNNGDLQQILEVYLFQSNHVVRNSTYLRHRALSDVYSVRNDTDWYILITFACSSFFVYALFFVMRSYNSFINSTDSSPESIRNNFGFVVDYKNSLLKNMKRFARITKADTGTVDVKFQTVNMPKNLTKPRSHRLDDVLNAVSLNNVLYDVFVGDTTSQSFIYVLFTIFLIYNYLETQIKAIASNIEPKDRHALLKVPALHSASFLIDIYFFVNGSKLASDFLQNFPSKKFQVCKQVLFVIKLTLKKALSFSPSFAFCTFAEHLLDKHFHHNVALEIPSLDYKTCNKKLTNILYVDTFYPLEQRCMPWTWFVSLEMQFFIVTCLVLLLAEIYSTYAIIIATVTFLISILASIVWESDPTTNMEEFSISTNMIYELTEFHLVFDNICLRISPYILGVCAGYILQRTHSNIKINMAVLICGWLAFLLMFGLFLFGYKYGYERLLPNISAGRWCQAILFTISHSMWSLMLFWITLTAETYQTWTPLSILLTGRYLHVLERLSPACLLVAPIVIRLLVFSGETAIYSSAGQTLSIFVGCLIASYLCAFLLHVLFDGPLCAILQEAVLN
ncbi:nose resistant to fluoxetine protein 6-like isoform X1 [Eurosta solidaginis]|uniref:nose resistant to fluoxetine protein 6-like isoform X1 n=1 Tax=Eurosta solidaginis TaxID=178769 RepID=UPI0035308FDD